MDLPFPTCVVREQLRRAYTYPAPPFDGRDAQGRIPPALDVALAALSAALEVCGGWEKHICCYQPEEIDQLVNALDRVVAVAAEIRKGEV